MASAHSQTGIHDRSAGRRKFAALENNYGKGEAVMLKMFQGQEAEEDGF